MCEFCFGPLEVAYDYESLRRTVTRESIASGPANMWRYADLLPVSAETPVNLGTGMTPLILADRLAAELGIGELWVKDDTRNPTGSFKDRVVGVALTKARELGFKVVACASTGNLANSVAAHAARAGIESFVFVPHDLETVKIITTAVFGGHRRSRRRLRRRQPALRRAGQRVPSLGLRECQRPALLRRGVKDPGLRGRRAARLGATRPCRRPIASGSQLTKIDKGFRELADLGLVETRDGVRVSGAQAQGCAPVATAFAEGTDHVRPVKPVGDREVARDRQPGRWLVCP